MPLPIPNFNQVKPTAKTIEQALQHSAEPKVFRGNQEARDQLKKDTSYTVHTMGSFNGFLELMKEFVKSRNKTTFVLRYTIRNDKQILFAGENDYLNAMEHFRMTGASPDSAMALAAGNIQVTVLADGQLQLDSINHKSGDFRPDLNSIRWILAALFFNKDSINLLIPENLSIEELNLSGGLEFTHQWKSADISTWLDANMAEEREALTSKQPQDVVEHEYKALVKAYFDYRNDSPERNFRSSNAKRKLSFDGSPDSIVFNSPESTNEKAEKQSRITEAQRSPMGRKLGQKLFDELLISSPTNNSDLPSTKFTS